MKKLFYVIFSLTAMVFLNSCAMVYKCGDSKPKKTPLTWSKNLKTVVSERDKLCTNLALKEKENAVLKNTISDMTGKNKDLTDKYNSLASENIDLEGKYKNLINESLSKTDQFNKALKAKSDELNTKEQLLSDREKALKEMQLDYCKAGFNH